MRLPHFRAAKAATAAAPAPPADASVDAYDVAYWFNYDWAVHQEDFTEESTYWWWVTSVRLDPNEVWMEADDGTLWVIPFSTDGESTVTVTGDPQRSRLVAVPAAAATDGATAAAAVDRRRQRLLATYHERPEKPERPTAAERPDNEEDPVRINIAALRQRLGISATELPDEATEEQVNAALEGDQPETPENPETPAEPAAEDEPQPEAPAEEEQQPAAASERTVIVDREVWEQTQQQVDQLSATARASEISELDSEADAAVADGRITPASREGWRASIDPGDQPTEESRTRATAERAALAALTPGRVPVTQRGTSTIQADAGYDRVRASMGLSPRKEN